MSEGSIGKFAVAFVEYGDACDGFPGILGVRNELRGGVSRHWRGVVRR